MEAVRLLILAAEEEAIAAILIQGRRRVGDSRQTDSKRTPRLLPVDRAWAALEIQVQGRMETWGNNNEDSHQISETRENRIHVEEVITFILVAKF